MQVSRLVDEEHILVQGQGEKQEQRGTRSCGSQDKGPVCDKDNYVIDTFRDRNVGCTFGEPLGKASEFRKSDVLSRTDFPKGKTLSEKVWNHTVLEDVYLMVGV